MPLALAVLLAAAATQPVAVTDGEAWNEGVDAYRAGDVTNALRVLRPLMLSKTHGARAAEVVAKLEHERGNREEAASAAQIALRAHPDDPRANRNFTRATDGLAAERETKRIDAVLKAAEGRDPGEMLRQATYEARALMAGSGTYRTNDAARVVALSDRLSAQAERLADVWIPVRRLIAQSVTNEEQAATIVGQVEAAQAKTRKAAGELADLDPAAYATLSDVEHDFTRFFKGAAPPPAAIGEDALAQSNAWQDVAAFNGRSWQQDALDFTRSFRARFPAWARAYEQQAQADTNKPPFTAEDQAKVSALATELEKLQLACCEKRLPPEQENALELIRQIRELLPKDPNGGGQQNPQQNPQQDQQQDQRQEPPQDGQQDRQDPSSEKQESQPEQADEQEGKPDGDKAQDPDRQELEALLKKAEERNDEHEADKKARMRKAPLPPNERDW